MPPPVEPPSPATPFPPANQLGLGNLQLPRRPLDRPSLSARPAQGRSSEVLSETLHMITIGSRRPQSVRDHAPTWWTPDAIEDTAMTEWDNRHANLLGRASRVHLQPQAVQLKP